MTEQERKQLADIAAKVDGLSDIAAKVEQLNRALFEVPPGSPPDERPLIEGLRIVWRSYQRGSWTVRALVWAVPATAAVLASVAAVGGYLKGGLLWFVK